MIKVYKIIKVSDEVNAELLFTKSLNSRTRDHSLKLVEHQIKAQQMKENSSLCSGYTICKLIPQEAVETDSINRLKRGLEKSTSKY